MSKQVGLDMKLYRNDGDFEDPDWVEVTNVRDLTGPDSLKEADVSRRAAGVNQSEPTLREVFFEWEMIYDPTDESFTTFQAAHPARSMVELAFADGDIEVEGTIYFRIEIKFTKFERSEPLEGANTYALTAKPCWGSRYSLETVEA